MSVCISIDIPEDLHEALRLRAASEQTSIRSLVIGATHAPVVLI
jgi:predicted HicB family RNase H-like nuclease